jgi:Domain of unknown function (DUF5666)
MLKARLSTVWACAMALAFAAPVLAQATRGHVEGTILAVNPTGTPPTVTIGAVTLNITASTVIKVGKNAGTIADLAVGTHANATFDAATKNALRIELPAHAGGSVSGQITAVNTGSSPPTVTIAGLTLNITPATRIRDNGVPGSISDLAVGLHARATYNAQTLNAVIILVRDLSDMIATGRVVSVDALGNVGVDVNRDGTADFTFATTGQTDVTVGVPAVQLSSNQLGLLMGLKVEVEYSVSGATADAIHAENLNTGEVSGVVSAVSGAAGTLSLQTPAGSLNDIQVAAGALITLNGQHVLLSQLQVGDTVFVTEASNGNHQVIGLRVRGFRSGP